MTVQEFAQKVCNKIDWAILYPILAESRRKKLKYTNFTVISNNCWGGRCYEYFGLPKQTPTVGAYFFATDYVRFCKNLKHYLTQELVLIPAEQSVHRESLIAKGEETALIGKLDDVEIVFLHYHDPDILLKKWKRRIERINWEHIILKFSYQNECSEELIKDFLSITQYPKFCLVGQKITGDDDEIVYRRNDGNETLAETVNFNWFVDPLTLINDRL